MKRDTTIFAPNLDAGPEFDPSKLYKGHAEGNRVPTVELFHLEQYL